MDHQKDQGQGTQDQSLLQEGQGVGVHVVWGLGRVNLREVQQRQGNKVTNTQPQWACMHACMQLGKGDAVRQREVCEPEQAHGARQTERERVREKKKKKKGRKERACVRSRRTTRHAPCGLCQSSQKTARCAAFPWRSSPHWSQARAPGLG